MICKDCIHNGLCYISRWYYLPERCGSFIPKRLTGEWVRKEDVIHSIAKQYSEHNELVPMWLSIGDIRMGEEDD